LEIKRSGISRQTLRGKNELKGEKKVFLIQKRKERLEKSGEMRWNFAKGRRSMRNTKKNVEECELEIEMETIMRGQSEKNVESRKARLRNNPLYYPGSRRRRTLER